jgi:hypothetical protein
VTGRATFGDLVGAARAQLRRATDAPYLALGRPPETTRTGQVQEFTSSMHRLVTVMTRYAHDIKAVLAPAASPEQKMPGTWSRASIQAQEAIQNAAAFLQTGPAYIGHPDQPHAADPATQRIDDATASLAAGRDLLRTHVAARPDGTQMDRSEWAPVVISAPVARALLLELGLWARRVAAHGARIALPGPAARHGTGDERWRLNAACQWLWVLDSAVQAAQHRQPVSAAEIQLLHAIPVNALAPRRIPGATETITSLCQGTTSTAERIRHAATIGILDATWSPELTADSLRHAAACSTVISHNCEILLRALALRAEQQGSNDIAAGLSESAEAAARARAAWLNAARAWYRITTDTRGTITPTSVETADLALWTGRLAYADPSWTPALGPSHANRAPQALAPEPADLRGVVAAVHQAWQTLTQIAAADHGQIRVAARAGRLLVPTRSLPDRFDIPHPFAPAPPDRVGVLLGAYDQAGTQSAQATDAVATIAESIRAPSHILTAARAAIRIDSGFTSNDEQQSAEPAAELQGAQSSPGPVERILHDLGITSPAILARATALDRLSEQLVLDATRAIEPQHAGLEAIELSRSTGSAELINQMLASGSHSAIAILCPSSPPVPQLSRADSDHAATNGKYIANQDARQPPEAEAEP